MRPIRQTSRTATVSHAAVPLPTKFVLGAVGVLVALFLLGSFTRGHAASLSSGGYTTSATVTPSAVAPGSSVTISASVTSTAASTVLVDIEVYSAMGTKVFQQAQDNQTFTAGQTRTFPVNWSVPASEPSGTHTVKVGVFAPGWGTVYHWNDNAATFTVSAGTTSPTPALTPTSSPARRERCHRYQRDGRRAANGHGEAPAGRRR